MDRRGCELGLISLTQLLPRPVEPDLSLRGWQAPGGQRGSLWPAPSAKAGTLEKRAARIRRHRNTNSGGLLWLPRTASHSEACLKHLVSRTQNHDHPYTVIQCFPSEYLQACHQQSPAHVLGKSWHCAAGAWSSLSGTDMCLEACAPFPASADQFPTHFSLSLGCPFALSPCSVPLPPASEAAPRTAILQAG